MNILYICGDDPRLTTSGSKIRTHFLWLALKRIGVVYTAVTDVADISDNQDRIRSVNLQSSNPVVRFFISFFRGVAKNASWPVHRRVSAVMRCGWPEVNFDRVVTRYVGRASRVSAWKLSDLIIDVDDMPLVAFRQMSKNSLPLFLRPISEWLVSRVQQYVLEKARTVFLVKNDDRQYVPSKVNCVLLPNLSPMPPAQFGYTGKQRKIILTVGMMGYDPNREGVNWFLKEVWPSFYKQHPDYAYHIVGGGATKGNMDRWNAVPGVKALGFVTDLDAVYETAALVVAPILTGAGTCIKVIESCVRGRKTLVTPAASRGYDVNKLQLGVFENKERFMREAEYWLSLGDAKRVCVQAEIMDAAKAVNSFDAFAAAVSKGVLA